MHYRQDSRRILKGPISESEFMKILDQFPFLDYYSRLFYPVPFHDALILCSKEIERERVGWSFYQKAVNIICEFISMIPQGIMEHTSLKPIIYLVEEFSSASDNLHPQAMLELAPLFQDLIESFFQIMKCETIESTDSSRSGRIMSTSTKRFVFSVLGGTVGESVSDFILNTWKRIVALLSKALVVDTNYFVDVILDVINDLAKAVTSKNEQTVSQAIHLYEQKNYFCCYLHVLKLILPEIHMKTTSSMLQSSSIATSPVDPIANEYVQELLQFTLTKAYACIGIQLEPMLLFCLLRVI
jgi:hypothetical protein